MISIKKYFDNPPKHLQSKNCQKKIKEVLREKKGHTISSNYYGHSTVRNNLEKLYHGKCAYCETKVAGSVLRIDHYRPKDKYYWLGYEWSNLLPACEKCNRAKSNAFPLEITGIRVINPPPSIYWRANSHTLLAEKTININKLNRNDLIIARKTLVDNFRNQMRQLADDFIETTINKETLHYSLKLLFNDILKAQSAEKTYSQLSWFMFKKFEIFFLKTLGTKQQGIIGNAFQLFKNGKF